MARTVRGLSPRPRHRHRPSTGHSLDHCLGLDTEPRLSVSASICVRTQSAPRVLSARLSQRTPLLRSRLQPLLPVRPRSPTPRVGRRSVRRKPGHQRHRSAQCTAQPEPVARGDHRTPSRGTRGWGRTARASGRVPGAGGQRKQLHEASMENGERKKLSSTSLDEDQKEENKLKQGIPQDLSSSPKLDRYKIARQLTEKAIKEKKIFSIYGHYPVIRATLRRKGWVEKKFHFLPKVLQNVEGEDNKSAETKENQEIPLERLDDIHDVMSRLVKNEMPYLLWTIKRDVVDYHSLTCDQMLNHYGKTASFTTKIGLCLNMRSLPWYVQANPNAFFPRCYGLCTESEKQEFLDDFRRTVASSILKWVVSHQNYYSKIKGKNKKEETKNGEPSPQKDPEDTDLKFQGLSGQLVDAACKVCQAYLGQLEHEDIDTSETSTEALSEEEWNDLTKQYYLLVHGNAFILDSRSYFSQCQTLLSKISSVNPQIDIDGIRNIWIIKPAAKSRGRDIVCMDRVESILELVATDNQTTKDNKWVVQKYIETPMLIYDTKFDIRQWFLVTDWNPLTIWFYKESYLRFSTQRFSLDKLDSAIHLCNNSIQRRLKNDKDRSPLLPGHNMWTSTRFQEYLQKRGRGGTWGSIIYPSMKRAVTNAMRVAQDHVEARKNSFELYGADFILGRDFKPWLIEINSSPTMHPSTPVTAQLCAQVQEDTIKVVVDRKLDRNCDIGNFELLWRQPAVELPPFNGSDLCVEGISMKKAKKQMPPITNLSFSESLSDTPVKVRSPRALPDPAIGSSRMTLRQDWKREEAKVLSATWSVPVMAVEGRGQTKPAYTFPISNYQHGDSKAPKSTFTRAQSTKLWDPNLTSVQHSALVLQNMKTMEKPQSPPPEASSGLPWDLQAPCLVCCGFRPPHPASLSLRLDTKRLLLLLGRRAARQLAEPKDEDQDEDQHRIETPPDRGSSLQEPTHRRGTLYTELF
ncbi:protein monoglycylase TTLL8 isoform X2 [Mesocricetus auratus]|uniref:Protein monoglycylase TTLL8 isoform X2 n=1 Tax=Mesocricetus auratus TaxID=10036 RepID=A0ABM2Y7F7_MESAU|nr:protein monoglycylase TTLL8 isoform X2 [Mesocricetus auratus]